MKLRYKTMGQAFEVWARSVLPPGVSPTQLIEVRRAFYSGAFLLFGMVMDITDQDEETSEQDLTNLHNEMIMFFRDIKDGKA